MNILIVEDEPIAAKQLKKLIREFDSDFEICGITDSISETVEILEKTKPDLIFMDIQLADGLSFEIFKQIEISTPVIFTTAFDKYAVDAFKVNSIDYLLKPITSESVKNAFANYEKMKSVFSKNSFSAQVVSILENIGRQQFKDRFLVKLGNKLIPVEISEVLYFFAEDKWTYIITKSNKKYLINYTLTQLEELLDPAKYFRLNRQYMVPRETLLSLESYFKGQVVVKLKTLESEKIVVSRQQTPLLKKWLEGE